MEDNENLDYPIVCNKCIIEMVQTGKYEWTCPKCNNHAFQENPNDIDSIYYEHNEDDIYEDIYESIPEGCNACGNPDFPNCINSCNLMSD